MRRGLAGIVATMLCCALAAPVVAAETNGSSPVRRAVLSQLGAVERAEAAVSPALPARSGALAPSAGEQLFRAPLRRHVVLGFVGAAGFGGVTAAELADSSILVTNVVNVTAAGLPSTSSTGWADLNDPSFPAFVARVHAAHDRVLLGLGAGSPAALVRMLRGAGSAATRLAHAILPILAAEHLDGVDLDVEGGPAEARGAFSTFVSALSRRLRGVEPATKVVVNVAPLPSAPQRGFFDARALASAANYLFVMAYDLAPAGSAGANAPLMAPVPQASDVSSLLAYASLVPPAKLLLGVPFYGYDFPTRAGAPGALATGPAESVTYGDIVAVGHVGHWDAATLTPYYVFRRGSSWHETYYDDPVSVALKTALASAFGIAGVGVWSLGQEGAQVAMLAALDGGRTPVKY